MKRNKYDLSSKTLMVILFVLLASFVTGGYIKLNGSEKTNTTQFVEEEDDDTKKIVYETAEEKEETEEVVESTNEETEEQSEEQTVDIFEVKYDEMLVELDSLSDIQNKRDWFIAYKELLNKYSEWIDPPLSVYDLYTSEEIYYMQKCIETETYTWGFDAACNVASVIFNRLENGTFGDNIIEIITTKNQFAYYRNEISEETKLALEYVTMFGDTVNGAIFFHSHDEAHPTFCGASYMFTDGCGHHFYK